MKNNQKNVQPELELTGHIQSIELEHKELRIGCVKNCVTLNVRKEPSIDSEICAVIKSDTDVVVQESESTQDFYKISTSDNIEGYCIKKYITIRT